MNQNDIKNGLRVKTDKTLTTTRSHFDAALSLLKVVPGDHSLFNYRKAGVTGKVCNRVPGNDEDMVLVEHDLTGYVAAYRPCELEPAGRNKLTVIVSDEVGLRLMAKKQEILEGAKALGIPITDISFEYVED